VAVTLLVAAGCANRVDVGWIGVGRALNLALDEGKVKVTEWSNSAMTMRTLAGAMGIPFIPVRFLGGSDGFRYSAAKMVKDPFTDKEVTLLPALNPDVGLIHVHQCDIYGNARIFGTSVNPEETAAASKKVIISTEEIIDSEYIRRDPGKTTIPYYMVDAVVEAPFGGHPGEVPGLYTSDTEAIMELMQATRNTDLAVMNQYLEKYVYSVATHQEYLEQFGLTRLLSLKQNAKIKEGYYE
jgi:acyl CoA:acetate/3-ketoacid CoA transferase alpha subunit